MAYLVFCLRQCHGISLDTPATYLVMLAPALPQLIDVHVVESESKSPTSRSVLEIHCRAFYFELSEQRDYSPQYAFSQGILPCIRAFSRVLEMPSPKHGKGLPHIIGLAVYKSPSVYSAGYSSFPVRQVAQDAEAIQKSSLDDFFSIIRIWQADYDFRQ
jgi:hypothetical protein